MKGSTDSDQSQRWRWRLVKGDGSAVQHECRGTVFVAGDVLRDGKVGPPIAHFPKAAEGERFAAYLNSLESQLEEAKAALAKTTQHVVDAGMLHLADETTIAQLERRVQEPEAQSGEVPSAQTRAI